MSNLKRYHHGVRTFTAWDTVVRELQEAIDRLGEKRDAIGGIPSADFRRMQFLRRLVSNLREEWGTEDV